MNKIVYPQIETGFTQIIEKQKLLESVIPVSSLMVCVQSGGKT